MIRRSDTTVYPNGNPEPGVYITVRDALGVTVPLFNDAGVSIANPIQSATDGTFSYNVASSGAYTEEYRVSLSDSPRTVVSVSLQQVGGTAVDMFLPFGQSLAIHQTPQVTVPSAIVRTLSMFNGGPEALNFATPSADYTSWPVVGRNMASLAAYAQISGAEDMGPGMAYQSYKAGVPRAFYCSFGAGGYSARNLHGAPLAGMKYGLSLATKLLGAAGLTPSIIPIWNHGHANADDKADGGGAGSGSPSSTANYLTACGKIFAAWRKHIGYALGTPYTGPIWIAPLLTVNSVITLAARRDIVQAQIQMPATIPGTRWLPPASQFANIMQNDLVHPTGQAVRYMGELYGAYVHSGLTPPYMVSKAVGGGVVTVTMDQVVKLATTVPEMGIPGNSKSGFTVIDNLGAEVPITAVSANGNTVTITPTTTANLSGSWYVRAGLQLTGTQGNVGSPVSYFPRTMMVGTTNVGTTQDGTVLENFQMPQEL